jgi:hypothetical protein
MFGNATALSIDAGENANANPLSVTFAFQVRHPRVLGPSRAWPSRPPICCCCPALCGPPQVYLFTHASPETITVVTPASVTILTSSEKGVARLWAARVGVVLAADNIQTTVLNACAHDGVFVCVRASVV